MRIYKRHTHTHKRKEVFKFIFRELKVKPAGVKTKGKELKRSGMNDLEPVIRVREMNFHDSFTTPEIS